MLKDKEPIEKIIKYTGLTKNEINKLKENSSKNILFRINLLNFVRI